MSIKKKSGTESKRQVCKKGKADMNGKIKKDNKYDFLVHTGCN